MRPVAIPPPLARRLLTNHIMTTAQNGKSSSAAGEVLPQRLPYLDGLRGFAALYVAIFHSYQMELFLTGVLDPGRSRLFLFLKPLCMGHYAVTVFIVLSGYCLMLPVARLGGSYPLKGGLTGFYKRRARRILPAFYAAVLVTLALLPLTVFAWNAVSAAGDANIRAALNPPTVSALVSEVVSHILLLNNGVPIPGESVVRFTNNIPLWSVATEWQIYFLFAMLLLPLLRRFGPWSVLVAGFGLGVFFTVGLHGRYAGACPWMLGVFSLGMLGALITHSPHALHEAFRKKFRWGVLSAITLAAFLGVGVTNLGFYRLHPILADTILGLGVMALLISLAQSSVRRDTRGGRWLVDLFSSAPACSLGESSYSLYLLHYPLLILAQALLVQIFPRSLYWVDFMMLVPVMAAIAGIAYLFSLAFERPFLGPNAKPKAAGEPPQGALIAPKEPVLPAIASTSSGGSAPPCVT